MAPLRPSNALIILDAAEPSVGCRSFAQSSRGAVVNACPSGLVDEYLIKQSELTAVAKFSQLHDDVDHPLQETFYRDLLPISPPASGQQYAFEVDLDKCTGCKGCVTACNSLNGLEPSESWRDVGLVHDTRGAGALQHVSSACHHCLEPACASGCPVDAYAKDDATGIVKHLDDQCIGCQYCTLMCPYDVPKFSKSLGIVRKCDMCSDRLAEGEAPACVQSCPTEAIAIKVVDRAEVIQASMEGFGVPGAPPSTITSPATTFKRSRGSLEDMVPADFSEPQKQHEHTPLIVMLTLTQVAVGVFGLDWMLQRLTGGNVASSNWWGPMAGLVICVMALGASIFHLGRSIYAFRAILGLKHSWLSREILAFGLFAKVAGLTTLLALWDAGTLPAWSWMRGMFDVLTSLRSEFELLTVGLGVFGVYCSVMVYHVTRRIFWHGLRTGTKFFLTGAVGGAAVLMVAGLARATLFSADAPSLIWFWMLQVVLVGSMSVKLGLEAAILWNLRGAPTSSLTRTARLHWEHMRGVCMARVGCGIFGGIVVPMAIYSALASGVMSVGTHACLAFVGLIAVLAGELLERYLFFTAVVALKMPGGIPG